MLSDATRVQLFPPSTVVKISQLPPFGLPTAKPLAASKNLMKRGLLPDGNAEVCFVQPAPPFVVLYTPLAVEPSANTIHAVCASTALKEEAGMPEAPGTVEPVHVTPAFVVFMQLA